MTAVRADVQQAGVNTAVAVLATLIVKGRAPMTGYTRAQFGAAWTDDNDDLYGKNGCDTRNDVLRRDLTLIALKSDSNGCAVATGVLLDPYTATSIHFVRGATSAAVQIDHVTPLGNAWQTGAQQLSARARVDLANDPLELLAVDGPTNERKGDGDAATWLPPNKSYRCSYVARQIAVKARYQLWVTRPEHDAMAAVLESCPEQTAPAEAGAPPLVLATTVATAPSTTAASTTAPSTTAPSTTAAQTQPVPTPTSSSAADASAGSPAGATALCKDGSFSFAKHHQGSCSHHGGVQRFLD